MLMKEAVLELCKQGLRVGHFGHSKEICGKDSATCHCAKLYVSFVLNCANDLLPELQGNVLEEI